MEIAETAISDVKVLVPDRHYDERGYLCEVYRRTNLLEAGIDAEFVQENHVYSRLPGTVRGLHFQIPPRPAAKLVRVIRGGILDVAVDLRKGSPTFGQSVAEELTADNGKQLFIPEGFAHGMCSLEPDTEVVYKATAYWDPELDRGIYWDDPELGIPWPVGSDNVVVSAKDRAQPLFAEIETLFEWDASRS
jgi:dTDP-4-dehydrorhamnose 3,5-epimerase